MIKAGVLGATGYAGAELVRLLSAHGNVEITLLGSKSFEGKKFSEIVRSHGALFPPYYANLIESGEETGCLPEVVRELNKFMGESKEYISSFVWVNASKSLILPDNL